MLVKKAFIFSALANSRYWLRYEWRDFTCLYSIISESTTASVTVHCLHFLLPILHLMVNKNTNSFSASSVVTPSCFYISCTIDIFAALSMAYNSWIPLCSSRMYPIQRQFVISHKSHLCSPHCDSVVRSWPIWPVPMFKLLFVEMILVFSNNPLWNVHAGVPVVHWAYRFLLGFFVLKKSVRFHIRCSCRQSTSAKHQLRLSPTPSRTYRRHVNILKDRDKSPSFSRFHS